MCRRKPITPTLVETIENLTKSEPLFSGIDLEKVRAHSEEYYDRELQMLGEHLVARETITREQLGIALGMQAKLAGDYKRSISILRDAVSETHKRAVSIAEQVDALTQAICKTG